MNIVPCDENGINEIIRSYENGEIIGFPTDTAVSYTHLRAHET